MDPMEAPARTRTESVQMLTHQAATAIVKSLNEPSDGQSPDSVADAVVADLVRGIQSVVGAETSFSKAWWTNIASVADEVFLPFILVD